VLAVASVLAVAYALAAPMRSPWLRYWNGVIPLHRLPQIPFEIP
jgi:hypothetical protein